MRKRRKKTEENMKRQSKKDRMDESKGLKKYYKDYPSKESRAGHKYNMSKKHREAESMGMKDHMDQMHKHMRAMKKMMSK